MVFKERLNVQDELQYEEKDLKIALLTLLSANLRVEWLPEGRGARWDVWKASSEGSEEWSGGGKGELNEDMAEVIYMQISVKGGKETL